jgi:predicted RNA methylase
LDDDLHAACGSARRGVCFETDGSMKDTAEPTLTDCVKVIRAQAPRVEFGGADHRALCKAADVLEWVDKHSKDMNLAIKFLRRNPEIAALVRQYPDATVEINDMGSVDD